MKSPAGGPPHAFQWTCSWLLRRERVAPAAGARRLGRVLLLEIAEDELTILALDIRHVVALGHPAQRVVPLRAAQALRGDELEIVAWRAGVERLVASGSLGQILRP